MAEVETKPGDVGKPGDDPAGSDLLGLHPVQQAIMKAVKQHGPITEAQLKQLDDPNLKGKRIIDHLTVLAKSEHLKVSKLRKNRNLKIYEENINWSNYSDHSEYADCDDDSFADLNIVAKIIVGIIGIALALAVVGFVGLGIALFCESVYDNLIDVEITIRPKSGIR